MPRATKKRRERKPFGWADVFDDAVEMRDAATVDDLRRAQNRFRKSMDAKHGDGAGDALRPGAVNVAKVYADLLGEDKPGTVGQWRPGVGIVDGEGNKL